MYIYIYIYIYIYRFDTGFPIRVVFNIPSWAYSNCKGTFPLDTNSYFTSFPSLHTSFFYLANNNNKDYNNNNNDKYNNNNNNNDNNADDDDNNNDNDDYDNDNDNDDNNNILMIMIIIIVIIIIIIIISVILIIAIIIYWFIFPKVCQAQGKLDWGMFFKGIRALICIWNISVIDTMKPQISINSILMGEFELS